MKLHTEKYSKDFIPHNLPELFQGCEKLEKSSTQIGCAYDYTTQTLLKEQFSHTSPVLHKI
jgi:hypothetical protein